LSLPSSLFNPMAAIIVIIKIYMATAPLMCGCGL